MCVRVCVHKRKQERQIPESLANYLRPLINNILSYCRNCTELFHFIRICLHSFPPLSFLLFFSRNVSEMNSQEAEKPSGDQMFWRIMSTAFLYPSRRIQPGMYKSHGETNRECQHPLATLACLRMLIFLNAFPIVYFILFYSLTQSLHLQLGPLKFHMHYILLKRLTILVLVTAYRIINNPGYFL